MIPLKIAQIHNIFDTVSQTVSERDFKYRDFVLRLYLRGRVWYIAVFKGSKRIRRVSTGLSEYGDAVKYLLESQDKLTSTSEPVSLESAFEQFLRQRKVTHKPSTQKGYKVTYRHLKRWKSNLLKCSLDELDNREIRDYLIWREDNSSVYRARVDYINLSAFFRFAKEYGFIDESPMRGIKKRSIPQKLPRWYTNEQLRKIEGLAYPELRDIIIFAHQTGMRSGELIKLQWHQIDINNKLCFVNNLTHLSKNNKVRSIPLTSSAYNILTLRPKEQPLVFLNQSGRGWTTNRVAHETRKILNRLGLDHSYNFHTFRHTFASHLVQKGVELKLVKELLGHSDLSTTEIYAHLRPDDLRNAISRLEQN